MCRSRKRECVCKCTRGCYSSSDSNSDSDDTVVCNKNYRTYICKPVCSSDSDSEVTEYNDSNLQYKLYQSVLQTFERDPTYHYMPDIETEDTYSGTNEETDVDDYNITGKVYDIRQLRQNKNYQLIFDAATREWRLTLIDSGCTVSIFVDRCLFQLRTDTGTHKDRRRYDICGM